jgi:hypothetical protein
MELPYDIWSVINEFVGFRLNLYYIRTMGELGRTRDGSTFNWLESTEHLRDLCQQKYLYVVADLSRIFRYFRASGDVLKYMRATRMMYNDIGGMGEFIPRMTGEMKYRRYRNVDRVYHEFSRKLASRARSRSKSKRLQRSV